MEDKDCTGTLNFVISFTEAINVYHEVHGNSFAQAHSLQCARNCFSYEQCGLWAFSIYT